MAIQNVMESVDNSKSEDIIRVIVYFNFWLAFIFDDDDDDVVSVALWW